MNDETKWNRFGDSTTDIMWAPQGWIVRADVGGDPALAHVPDPGHTWEDAREACGLPKLNA